MANPQQVKNIQMQTYNNNPILILTLEEAIIKLRLMTDEAYENYQAIIATLNSYTVINTGIYLPYEIHKGYDKDTLITLLLRVTDSKKQGTKRFTFLPRNFNFNSKTRTVELTV